MQPSHIDVVPRGSSTRASAVQSITYKETIQPHWYPVILIHPSIYLHIQPRMSAMSQLPVEIIQHIYSQLSPRDFQAARLVCRRWMAAGQDAFIVREQMLRSGWSRIGSPAAASRYLLSPSPQPSRSSLPPILKGERGPLLTITSHCGTYLLAASNTRLHVYRLEQRGVILLYHFQCGRRVLATCMDDTATHLVAMLEGRMAVHVRLDQLAESAWNNGTSSSSP